ncbi:MAG: amino acid ABC transporter permease [Oscillospiraceae bacterium]
MKSIEAFFVSLPKLLTVLPATILLFIAIVCMGILLGLLLAFVRIGKKKILKAIVAVFISFERGTPLLIQIMIVYFGLRAILVNGFGITGAVRWNAAYFAFIAYGLNLSAFLSETFRGAYLSIERGQIEAAESIGMTKFQVFRRVILPQGARIALPNMGNLLLDDFKAISLAFSIGVIEIMGRGTGLANAARGVGAIGIYSAVALVYWVICFLMDKLFVGLERHLSKDLRVMGASGTRTIVK